jgi:hypothetical protein
MPQSENINHLLQIVNILYKSASSFPSREKGNVSGTNKLLDPYKGHPEQKIAITRVATVGRTMR